MFVMFDVLTTKRLWHVRNVLCLDIKTVTCSYCLVFRQQDCDMFVMFDVLTSRLWHVRNVWGFDNIKTVTCSCCFMFWQHQDYDMFVMFGVLTTSRLWHVPVVSCFDDIKTVPCSCCFMFWRHQDCAMFLLFHVLTSKMCHVPVVSCFDDIKTGMFLMCTAVCIAYTMAIIFVFLCCPDMTFVVDCVKNQLPILLPVIIRLRNFALQFVPWPWYLSIYLSLTTKQTALNLPLNSSYMYQFTHNS